jgi:hypothetical protein
MSGLHKGVGHYLKVDYEGVDHCLKLDYAELNDAVHQQYWACVPGHEVRRSGFLVLTIDDTEARRLGYQIRFRRRKCDTS